MAKGPVLAAELIRQAEDAGISERRLRYAKAKLRVTARKRGGAMVGAWEWVLRKGDNKKATTPQVPTSSQPSQPSKAAEDCRTAQKKKTAEDTQDSESVCEPYQGRFDDAPLVIVDADEEPGP